MLAKQEKITHILMVHAFMDIHGHWGGLLLLYQHKRIVSESRIQDVEVPSNFALHFRLATSLPAP